MRGVRQSFMDHRLRPLLPQLAPNLSSIMAFRPRQVHMDPPLLPPVSRAPPLALQRLPPSPQVPSTASIRPSVQASFQPQALLQGRAISMVLLPSTLQMLL